MLWRIRMLGEFVLERNGREARRFRYQKAASLLAYLALNRGRAHSREALVELLWPDEEPEAARNRFRVMLTSLRHQLEPPGISPGSVLISHGSALLQLNPETTLTDVAEFEAALRRGDAGAALSLYKGELLPGLYDDWLTAERERLTSLAEEAQEKFAGVAIPHQSETLVVSAKSISLPTPLTQFFGREAEIGDIGALLTRFRLVTLIGPGGAGKTRLATEAAQTLWEMFPDGVFFVSLAERFDPAQIGETIRGAMGVTAAPERGDAFSQIVQYLSGRRVLLILDNFEQLVAPGGGTVVESLLAAVPSLHSLVTSRRALGVAGEREFPVSPLPIPPDLRETPDLAEIAQSPAVALLLDRAAALRPDFTLTSGNAGAIIAICQKLDGLPLALELAAARLRAATPAQIRDGLTKRFDLLARTERWADKDHRHSSLRLTLDWGWRLLPLAQQQFFARLSVFRGGWTADAAAHVTEVANAQVALESLIADSLARAETQGEETRFRMLETLREFAAERLPPAEKEPLAQRHAEYFLARMESWDALRFHAVISPLSRWLESVLPELGNLRAALYYFRASLEARNVENEARLVGAMSHLFVHLGLTREGEANIAAAEARYTEPTPIRAFLLYRGTWLAQRRGDRRTARRRATECLALYQAAGDPIGLSFGWNAVGQTEGEDGDLAGARSALEKAVTFAEQARNPDFPDTYVYRDIPAGNLSGVLLEQGDFAAAHRRLTELLQRERERCVRHGSGVFRNYIQAMQGLGRTAEAEILWREFLQEAFAADNHFGVIEALEALSRLSAGQPDRAATLLTAAQRLRRTPDTPESAPDAPPLAEIVRMAVERDRD